jgi:NAD(P)-dependent dehydrogenase (short-subunit alcohol dehydrogenase family)
VVVAADITEQVTTIFNEDEKVFPVVMDVSSESSIMSVREKLHEQGIRVRYLVNNAGTHSFFPVSEATEELLDTIVKVNVYGQVLTVSVFLDDLIAAGGRVVQVSSDSVRLPIPFYTYPASKMAMEAFSISMRRELQLHGIRLILVRPGAMDTPFLESMKEIRNEVPDSRYAHWFRNFARMSKNSVGKMTDPADVANVIMEALQAGNPRLVYSINRNRKISFFSRFPERWKDRMIRKAVT